MSSTQIAIPRQSIATGVERPPASRGAAEFGPTSPPGLSSRKYWRIQEWTCSQSWEHLDREASTVPAGTLAPPGFLKSHTGETRRCPDKLGNPPGSLGVALERGPPTITYQQTHPPGMRSASMAREPSMSHFTGCALRPRRRGTIRESGSWKRCRRRDGPRFKSTTRRIRSSLPCGCPESGSCVGRARCWPAYSLSLLGSLRPAAFAINVPPAAATLFECCRLSAAR